MTAEPYVIANDDLWPRDLQHRYRLVAQRGGELHVLAACPEPGGIGQAIVTLHDDEKQDGRRFDDLGVLGLLDVCPGGELSATGEWVVTPFPRPERRTTVGTPPQEIRL